MKYPKIIRALSNSLGFISGLLVFILAILCTVNTFGRYFLSTPLTWCADTSRYLLIYIIFLAAPFGFQEKSHVCVDLVTNVITKNHPKFKRGLRLFGYIIGLPFICILGYRGLVMAKSAFAIHRLTTAVFQIPQGILYLAIFIGCVLMVIQVIFIILSLIAGEDTWLDA